MLRISGEKSKLNLMNPKIDFVFKSIFGNEKHPDILISFLNAVLKLENDKKIVKVEIENPNIEKEDIEDKYSILDVKATANDNTKLDIEIQIRDNNDMIPRTIYYLSKLIEGQMKEGDNYNQILKSVTINILDFNLLKKNKKIHNVFLFREKETGEILTDLAEIHFLEMPKLRNETKLDVDDLLNDWLLFIENPESEEIKMLTKRVKEIDEAQRVLERLSLDRNAIAIYEKRQKALKDKMSALSNAKAEGIKEIAINMIGLGLSYEIISKSTGLGISEIESLIK